MQGVNAIRVWPGIAPVLTFGQHEDGSWWGEYADTEGEDHGPVGYGPLTEAEAHECAEAGVQFDNEQRGE